ncbi:BirA family biotin operon repressor/biotin-[acetyl-CoA-carboxylase] ligase [Mesonia hippocampi]|uniref:BirA family biotin operon repressor/biotin-[acetyl-CoA-carboxylase] ligase n=1 Tax=Mesonia hippocampi TaxID=1628250 RepID=A0A840ENY8_9FLAO|nr:biotin--[acetyl-CoA-carboxylase] ligase [Mesonia hippocampi]MBB4118815.1 BirA family biotin operon repressor/biotin-[acetyl-CoA-carboxylase] ligase [Mesonia hippocampi]
MRSIKVHTTNSTNVFLSAYYREQKACGNVYVVAEKQTSGKGQMGTVWHAEAGKNLTFSVLIKDVDILLAEQFKLSALVALSVIEVLEAIKIPKVEIKWPNDILADKCKVSGILIENVVVGAKINASIIGIGLNVNQLLFDSLPKVTSLSAVTGKKYDLEELAEKLANTIETNIYEKQKQPIEAVLAVYYQKLLGYKKVATYQLPSGENVVGVITKVTPSGFLNLALETQEKQFAIKEIKQLY